LDWDITSTEDALHTTTTWKTKRNCSSTQQTTLKQISRTTLAETTADRKTKGQAAPHRKDRRHAGPNAIELLQPNRPPDDVKITETEATHSRVRGDYQPATQHASLVRGDLQTRRTGVKLTASMNSFFSLPSGICVARYHVY
jgi:hypothetical protein